MSRRTVVCRLLALLVILATVTAAQADVLYSENFDELTNPNPSGNSSITGTPWNWTTIRGDNNINVALTPELSPFGSQYGISGANSLDSTNQAAGWQFGSSLALNTNYTATWDMWETSNGGDSWFGLRRFDTGTVNITGGIFAGVDGNQAAVSWFGNVVEFPNSTNFSRVPVAVTLQINTGSGASDGTATVTINDGTETRTLSTTGLDSSLMLELSQVAVFQHVEGVSIDNILVQTTPVPAPEPTTLMLLFLSVVFGLVALYRRRNRA